MLDIAVFPSTTKNIELPGVAMIHVIQIAQIVYSSIGVIPIRTFLKERAFFTGPGVLVDLILGVFRYDFGHD